MQARTPIQLLAQRPASVYDTRAEAASSAEERLAVVEQQLADALAREQDARLLLFRALRQLDTAVKGEPATRQERVRRDAHALAVASGIVPADDYRPEAVQERPALRGVDGGRSAERGRGAPRDRHGLHAV
ncbi:hypothetical protein GA0115233_103081 [Streptomyces sp. DI166]|uniref:hypothetical protein n=1 Tax=Streptomyces sp. DI166 TaxID=1839783 RepID=UPI0007F379D7|nr:hypothetical protein [Streptomyces sp. DI166]SBT91448.1 hypothetical protein GA0115233_103081 [Streptomyces sp. DI166]